MKYIYKITFILLLLGIQTWAYAQTTAPQKLLDSLKTALKQTTDNKEKIKLLKAISDVYNEAGEYNESLACLLEALKLKEQMPPDTLFYATLLSDIGSVYNYMFNHAKCRQYYLQALQIMESIPCDTDIWVTTLNNTGLTYNNTFPDSSLLFFKNALKLAKKTNFLRGISLSLGNIGYSYEMSEDYPNALIYYKESLVYALKRGDPKSIAFCYNNLGFVCIALKKFEEALVNLKTGLSIARKARIMDVVRDSYEGLAKAYSENNDYKSAFDYEKLLHFISDSLYNIESSRQVAEMQTKYESEKKDKELLKKDAETKQKTTERNAFVVGFGLMLVLAFFIFRGYRQKQKTNIKINKQKQLIEEKQKEILDSIYYARRIQRSLMPTEKYIEKKLTGLRNKENC